MIQNTIKPESFELMKYQFFLQREIWELIDRAARVFPREDYKNFLSRLIEDATSELNGLN